MDYPKIFMNTDQSRLKKELLNCSQKSGGIKWTLHGLYVVYIYIYINYIKINECLVKTKQKTN